VEPFEGEMNVNARQTDVELFGWDDQAEPAQAERYMPYLQRQIGVLERCVRLMLHFHSPGSLVTSQSLSSAEEKALMHHVICLYVVHMRCHIFFGMLECRSAQLLNGNQYKELLNVQGKTDELGYDFRGTTDAIIVTRSAAKVLPQVSNGCIPPQH
jgi:hypothetical protein